MIQNVTSIQVAFVVLVLARFEILDHCYLSVEESYKVTLGARGFFYFRYEAAIVSGKATHQTRASVYCVNIKCK